MRIASAPGAQSAARLPDFRSRNPSPDSGREKTRASGNATPSEVATLRGPASWSLPAPTRNAATPARSSAPGTSAAPPITIATPRSSLSADEPGCGNCHRRRSGAVTAIGLLLARAKRRVRLRCHGSAGLLEGRNEVVELETHVTAGSESLIVLVKSHGTVCDLRLLVDGEDFCLSEVLEDIAHAKHDHRVTNDKDALTTVIARYHLGRAAQPQDDIAPALSSGWTVIELSEQAAVLSLLGELLLDSDVSQPVQNSKLFLAESFVDQK